ncbi:MAG: hypothetical protein JSW26_24095 [Desulfobacterales bacterium]|nr:MAG: hypothetical protein JSW26_24095 [Desulfobacterales bacterium]
MKMSRKTKTCLWLATIYILSCLSLIIPKSVFAGKTMTWEGTIQGLNCTHFQRECPKDDLDMYIALENDFVLVTPDGRHYLLPNLSVLIKARYLTRNVRVTAEQKVGDSIWVENLEVKKDHAYETVWNYAEQERRRTEP